MRFDLAVVGAGPAGLAAAVAAAQAGRSVALVDANPLPGGQFWRHRPGDDGSGHRDWTGFRRLRSQLSKLDYRPATQVWFIEPGHVLHTSGGAIEADRLVLATGSHDRVTPFPGWELPGVVTAGGAQALLKGLGTLVGQRVVVAGTGPFLLPVASGLARAGARVPGVFEAAGPAGYLRRPPPLGKVIEAAGYLADLARRRIPYRLRHQVIVAEEGAVTVAAFDQHGRVRSERVVACDVLAVGYGFTPQVELAISAGCATVVDGDGSLVVEVDAGQATTVAGVHAAGEITGVGGAELALVEGQLAGLTAAGVVAPGRLLRRRERLRRFAVVVAAAHPVPDGWQQRLPDDTKVCRCERVPAGEIRAAARDLGAIDGRGVKLLTRAGMGWCQGRVCGYAATCLVAVEHRRAPDRADLSAFATRPIAQPITLADLAGSDHAGSDHA